MSTTRAADVDAAETQLYSRRWWALAVLCLSLLIVFVGNSSLNVAIPTLSRDLDATESQLQWVVAIYSLVFAGLLFTTGALGDRFGRKGALQIGLVLFLFGALLATAVDRDVAADRQPRRDGRRSRADHAVDAVDHHQHLPAPRTTQGDRDLGEHHRRGRRDRARRQRLAARATSGTGRSSSSTSRSFWSRSFRGSSCSPSRATRRKPGSIPSVRSSRSIGIVFLVYGLIEAPGKGWASAVTLGALAIAALVLALFVAWELHVDEPMLDMHLLPQARVQHGHRRHDPRLRVDVRRHVPHHAVLPARARLQRPVRRAAPAADRADHAGRRALHAAAERAVRRAPDGRVRDALHRHRLRAVHAARRRTPRTRTWWCA